MFLVYLIIGVGKGKNKLGMTMVIQLTLCFLWRCAYLHQRHLQIMCSSQLITRSLSQNLASLTFLSLTWDLINLQILFCLLNSS